MGILSNWSSRLRQEREHTEESLSGAESEPPSPGTTQGGREPTGRTSWIPGLKPKRNSQPPAPKEEPRVRVCDLKEGDLGGSWVALDHCSHDELTGEAKEGDLVDSDEDLTELCGRLRDADRSNCEIVFCERKTDD